VTADQADVMIGLLSILVWALGVVVGERFLDF